MSQTINQNNFNYTDLQSLDKLKYQGQDQQNDSIKQVAEQFAAIYNQMMMSSMRQANEAFTSESLGSESTKMYQDLYDKQMAINFSALGGQGSLADEIEKQIRAHDGSANATPLALQLANQPTATDNAASSNSASESDTILPLPFQQKLREVTAMVKDKVQEYSQFKTPEDFVKAVWNDAVRVGKSLNLDPKFLIAQAALETGWGQKPINHTNGENSFNVFGIKADNKNNTGSNATVTTTEYYNGVPQTEKAAFRSYGSFSESFDDYAKFLSSNPRYQTALTHTQDTAQFARELQRAGYATDPHYADKIIKLMQNPALKNMSSA